MRGRRMESPPPRAGHNKTHTQHHTHTHTQACPSGETCLQATGNNSSLTVVLNSQRSSRLLLWAKSAADVMSLGRSKVRVNRRRPWDRNEVLPERLCWVT